MTDVQRQSHFPERCLAELQVTVNGRLGKDRQRKFEDLDVVRTITGGLTVDCLPARY
jgi:ribosome-associated protein YbcJ (S4-like RNA binding protein)